MDAGVFENGMDWKIGFLKKIGTELIPASGKAIGAPKEAAKKKMNLTASLRWMAMWRQGVIMVVIGHNWINISLGTSDVLCSFCARSLRS